MLTSRYTARALRLLRDRSARFEVIHMPALTVEDTLDILGCRPARCRPTRTRPSTPRARVQALADGRPAYVRALADELAAMREQAARAATMPISALVALHGAGGRLSQQCGFCYELRLHRARGYGALKAILEILAEEEGLTLTEISQRLQRTPGSTKDYLSWLEDVDLVTSRQKRYSYHRSAAARLGAPALPRRRAPTEDDLAREVHRYALPRLPQQPEPALAMAAAGAGAAEEDARSGGLSRSIESAIGNLELRIRISDSRLATRSDS